jgi:conjugative transposon TraM protein
MENKINMRQHALQRKFYLALPVLVLPFVTALYWLWVVRPASDHQPTQQVEGLLTSVPDAMLGSDKQLNKLSFYRQAEADSDRLQTQIRKDPYLDQAQAEIDSFQAGELAGLQGPFGRKRSLSSVGSQVHAAASVNERKVYEKLKDLDQVLARASSPDFEPDQQTLLKQANDLHPKALGIAAAPDADLASQTGPQHPDPEIEQLNGVLDKILAIQDPQGHTDSGGQDGERPERKVLTVSVSEESAQTDAVLSAAKDSSAAPTGVEGAFFSLEEPVGLPVGSAISAEIDQDQTLVSGQVLRLRLTQEVFIAGSRLPRGTLVSGKASINNQRLMAEIESIQFENAILPVRLSVYDLDGIAGIHIPDEVARQVAKQSLSQDIQGVDIGAMDPSLAGQAVGAGIQTAQSLLSRKARLIQINVHDGYRVLLLGKPAL